MIYPCDRWTDGQTMAYSALSICCSVLLKVLSRIIDAYVMFMRVITEQPGI